ncbi:MAG: hypothetical protein F4089_07190 [Gammaproteobacteria bacterium]|nr:hypothetical protein [Acidobacteriota bacterium]MYA15261.1 hypothetical protein [Gammaproteobacteria bacterium]MYJ74887.1 hypothetical protein [Gammaproteobacteria bacterium]
MADQQLRQKKPVRDDELRERKPAEDPGPGPHPIYGDATPEQVALGLRRNVAEPVRKKAAS